MEAPSNGPVIVASDSLPGGRPRRFRACSPWSTDSRGHGTPPPHFLLADEPHIRLANAGGKVTTKDFSRLIREFVAMKEYAPDAFELTAEPFRPSFPAPLFDAFVAVGGCGNARVIFIAGRI